jgi:hypothetical protein
MVFGITDVSDRTITTQESSIYDEDHDFDKLAKRAKHK